jgi:hypothetical protein
VFFSGSSVDGIEMVQALDAQLKAVPAASIEGMNMHRLLFSWLESL